MVEKYGRARIRQIVAHFYERVLRSPKLSRYFDDIDIQGLVAHQTAFLAAVMGGAPSHSAQEIEGVHRPLDVTGEDFDAMIELLERSLRRFDIATEDIDVITSRYERFRTSVVGSGSQSGE